MSVVPVNVTQCNHVLLSEGSSSLWISPPRLSSTPTPPNHCFLPPTLRCSRIALICIAAFPPLSMSFYSWPFLLLSVIHRLRGRSLIPQSSRWSIRPLLAPPPPFPEHHSRRPDTCSPPSLGHMLRDAQTLAISSFNAPCFSIFIPSWLFLCRRPLEASFQERFLLLDISVLVDHYSFHSVVKNDDTEESGPPPLTVEFESSGHFVQTRSALKDRTTEHVGLASWPTLFLLVFFPVSHMHCPPSVHPLGPVNTCSISTSSCKLFSLRQQVYGPNFIGPAFCL